MSYAYGDAGWKDKLTSFDGKPITHDTIGNPLTYDGWAYTWKAGRMLHSMARGGENPVTAQFTYDHTGLRVKKTVNRVDTFYTLNGKKITHIRKGTNGAAGADAVQMHFVCDAQGRPILVRTMDVDYAYLHNLQGDVVGIVDMNDVPVVEYGYDAWGKPVSVEGSMAETLGKDNPFRYRGYVWDEETGLYYLRSRYYDPCWGRFVNADTILGKTGTILDHNIFCNCRQNPITGSDQDGLYDPDDPDYFRRQKATRGTTVLVGVKNPNYRPYIGKPGSTYTAPNGDSRTYGSDGKPIRDVDTGHPDHHPGVGSPHVHEWPDGERSTKPYALPPSPESSQAETETNHEMDWGAVGLYALGTIALLGGGAYFLLTGDPGIVQNAMLSMP